MAVVYIKEQGALVHKIGERLIVSKRGNTLLDFPVIKIDNLAVIGNVQITMQALQMLMEKGVDVSYFSYSGKYLGHTAADSSKNVFLRLEQYAFYNNMDKRLEMARLIVRNKVGNQIALIQKHRWDGQEYDWKADVQQMQRILVTLADKKTTNELMGVEGICSSIYYGAFGKMLKCDFSFSGRNRRPPRDPINAILSLSYTFLTKEMCSALDAESFETYLGFLHGIRYGRKSLALDMVEEFRQPLADRFVILLFNKRMLSETDFEFPEDGSVVLNEDGFRKFCYEYERWMNGKNSISGESSFRRLLQEQVMKLKRSICRGEPYEPYDWSKRNVCG